MSFQKGNKLRKGLRPLNSFNKGHIPWNKGLTKNDNESILKSSLRMTVDNPIYKINQKGENNFNWKHGNGRGSYPKEYKKIRKYIIARDKHTCRLCFKKKDLCVHHIDYNKKNNEETNLICLCRKCNLKVNADRAFWQGYMEKCRNYGWYF